MKILVIDCRIEQGNNIRGETIADGIRLSFAKIDVEPVLQVNGTVNGIGGFTDVIAERCGNYVKGVKPDLILLHVGRDQDCAVECLKWIYTNDIVVCYSGSPFLEEVSNDCAMNSGNPKHCCYPGRFETFYGSPEDWRFSPEGGAVLKFIAAVEEHLKKVKDGDPKADETLQKVKETLQNFNPKLENALDILTVKLNTLLMERAGWRTAEQLSILLQGGKLPNEQSPTSIAHDRDNLLQDVYQ